MLSVPSDLTYDPYNVEINIDPYPTYRRLRDEAPLYYNEEHDFYALSRFEDVERGLKEWQRYISGRGAIIEIIKLDMEFPPGVLIFEDPPLHTGHRGLLSRVFTPKKMNALEGQIRDFCARSLDPLVGGDRFDFIEDLGKQMPMRVIGMLLGIPETDQEAVRDRADANLRTQPGKKMKFDENSFDHTQMFAEYVDWRRDNPSDDLTTELINAEFEDDEGVVRTLTREEVLMYLGVLAGAGNETTTRLIGWTGKVLGDHPEQRAQLVADPSLIPGAIEEILRYEGPAPHVARYVTTDVEELHGETVPAGSSMMMLIGAANRDDRRWSEGDRFDIHRKPKSHLAFGYGIHFCLGAALARIEGRVALEEVLKRFPEWEVEIDGAKLSPTSTVRGWEQLPTRVA
ncbi:MAG: cytochrome P450 [Acidimicrobiia bacterium]|nr:cytochrome P450 [Acidimicrobiia bacterium]